MPHRQSFVHGATHEYIDWYDTDGNVINCSDGGMVFVDGTYYWYGQELRAFPARNRGSGGQVTTTGVVMYSSTDLYQWKREGLILACSDNPESELYGPMRFERPKIIFNDSTRRFVLWCHYVKHPGDHGNTPGTSEAGIASCETVNGTYQWHGTTRPIEEEGLVRDSALYKELDGTAYFIYDKCSLDSKNRCLVLVKLTDDYLGCTDAYVRDEALYWREAPSIVYHNGYYFMFTSGLTSWTPNPARYFRATKITGPWVDMGDPCVDDVEQTTFNSQSTYVFPVEGKTGLFIHMAERHNTENFLHCSYIWLPVAFPTPDTARLTYRREWSLEDL